ncbi:SDR family NAD(P)-dependent oxidoreductase [Sulfurovum mangrovi]|uniref:SDR family NAD(P)-dependent oxidoreductase n=1 Tax=Sulfurovum mangrovi TaxID=2893889 RepID=UPI001E62B7C0|nr:SDR family oxidoreductase [Sulfurovum mangrovi]UFH58841.1 SDR family oxidoreductase [Sulfurovum mangrovi]
MKLENKVCIITGAGKGIGRDTAILFAQLGCKLALISKTREDLVSLSNELQIDASDLYWVEGDVSLEDSVKEFVSNVYEKFGRIDILVNNAGMRFRKEFLEIEYQEWQKVMNVNAGSTFLFCKEVGKYMIKQKYGKIINMASIIGTLGLPELVGYGASKGAIISLTKSLAVEWAEYNINVNVVAPGFCKTSYAEKFKEKSELYDFTIDRTPMKAWGESRDISNAIAFLASDMSRYITGEVISIDGGWSAW